MELAPFSGRAHVIGLTGPPGVGKSTSTSALVGRLRAAGRRVGVLAVDPSSPYSKGALLGDRIRMAEHACDDGVFIRSMASRGQLGGLSAAVPQAVRVLDAAGCDVVLIETVGVGQNEFEIASLADTVVLLLAPGMGDGVQAAKAGIVEVGDIFVVNKADRDGADQVVRDLRTMQSLGGRHSAAGAWRPPIVTTIASRGEGVDDLVTALDKHREWLTRTGTLATRRSTRAAAEIESITLGTLQRSLAEVRRSPAIIQAAQAVAQGAADPYSAAEAMLRLVLADPAVSPRQPA
ncbi:MAG: Lysine arginine ornithine transport system kinase [Jatrophihabitans sp.]|nr:Lysine arginine ornithine transport system kinase [Jatrophihabitans sp.]